MRGLRKCLLFLAFPFFVFAQSYHTITIDGVNDFVNSTEQFQTTSGTTLYSYITWDKNYLYFGLSGNSGSGPVTDGGRVYHIYIDTDPQKTPTMGSGTVFGEAWRYSPTLPFAANFHYAFKTADNAEFRREYVSTQWQNSSFQTSNWKGNSYWELKIDLAGLGNPKQLNILSYVEEDWSNGWLSGGLPSNLFTNNTSGGAITFASHWLNLYLINDVTPNISYNFDNFNWMIRLKAASGSLSDSSAFAGMAIKATNAYDAGLDIPKPPTPPSNYLEVFFPHSNWTSALGPFYIRDVKALVTLDSLTSSWDFTVRTDAASANVVLTADQFSFVPANYNIIIQDIAADSLHNVRTRGAYTYNCGAGGDKYFRLIVGVSLSSPHIVVNNSTLNFGTVKVGRDSSITLNVSNSGDSALVISNIVSSLGAFTFGGGTTHTITRNSSVDIPVKFTPTSAATFSGTLTITSNDPQNPVKQISLQGVGQSLVPNISVNPASLNFGSVKIDFDSTMSFKVYNTGDTTLNITGISNASALFKIVGSSVISVNKNDSAAVTVKFSPLAAVTYNDTLLISNNSATPTVKLALTGIGTNVTLSHLFTRGWNLMSVPITESNASVGSVIGDDLTGFALFSYTNGGYTNADSVFAGNAYWLGIENNGTVDVTGAPKTGNISKAMNTGWNLLASPYVRSYAKSKIQFKRGAVTVNADSAVSLNWIQNTYYSYRQSDSSFVTSAELAPWSGYLMAGLKDSVQMYFVHDSAGSVAASMQPERPLPDVNNWAVTILAKTGTAKDNMLSFGVSSLATDGFDARYDMAKPPAAPVTGTVESYFYKNDWSQYFSKYMSDIRAPYSLQASPKQWEFRVSSQNPGTITVSWPDIASQIPQQIRDAYKFEISGLGFSGVNMLSTLSISAQVLNGRDYSLFINSKPLGVIDNSGQPSQFILSQNYPNPFNPETRISYQTRTDGKVMMKVYDIIGSLVATLVNQSQPAGQHETVWNAAGYPSGVYYCELTSGTDRMIRKMVLMK